MTSFEFPAAVAASRRGEIDFSAGVGVMLVRETPPRTASSLPDIRAHEAKGAGYKAKEIPARVNPDGSLDIPPVKWERVTITAKGAVLYSPKFGIPIAYVTFGGSKTSTAGSFEVELSQVR